MSTDLYYENIEAWVEQLHIENPNCGDPFMENRCGIYNADKLDFQEKLTQGEKIIFKHYVPEHEEQGQIKKPKYILITDKCSILKYWTSSNKCIYCDAHHLKIDSFCYDYEFIDLEKFIRLFMSIYVDNVVYLDINKFIEALSFMMKYKGDITNAMQNKLKNETFKLKQEYEKLRIAQAELELTTKCHEELKKSNNNNL